MRGGGWRGRGGGGGGSREKSRYLLVLAFAYLTQNTHSLVLGAREWGVCVWGGGGGGGVSVVNALADKSPVVGVKAAVMGLERLGKEPRGHWDPGDTGTQGGRPRQLPAATRCRMSHLLPVENILCFVLYFLGE